MKIVQVHVSRRDIVALANCSKITRLVGSNSAFRILNKLAVPVQALCFGPAGRLFLALKKVIHVPVAWHANSGQSICEYEAIDVRQTFGGKVWT